MSLDPVALDDPHVPAHNAERDAINALQEELATKIDLPPGLATGDLLVWDGTKIVSTETRFFEGQGGPNGVVAAPVGSRYVDKLATQGAVEWVKNAGGEGNTGWATAVGFYSVTGQSGTATLTGPLGTTKSFTAALEPAIFKGVAPRQVLLTAAIGGYTDVTHPYLVAKTATSLSISGKRIDGSNYPAAATVKVDWVAIV